MRWFQTYSKWILRPFIILSVAGLLVLVSFAYSKAGSGLDALVEAVRVGDIQTVKRLVADKQVEINGETKLGWSPLFMACASGRPRIVTFLVDNGADVNRKNLNSGLTPMDVACKTPRRTYLEPLLQALGARGRCKKGKTHGRPEPKFSALTWAAVRGHKDVVNILLSRGADVNSRDESGRTPLIETTITGNKKALELLLAKGADINASTYSGSTALMTAALIGHKDALEFLISKGADINAKANNGNTALMLALRNGKPDLARILINHEADVEILNNGGGSALMAASYNGYTDIVKTLLSKGADVNTRSKQGWTALWIAKRKGRKDIIKLLKEHGAKQ